MFLKQMTYSGLKNLDNTCYANSAVQALFHIESVREEVKTWSSNSKTENQHFYRLFKQMRELPVVNPINCWTAFKFKGQNWNQQHCTAEFLEYIVKELSLGGFGGNYRESNDDIPFICLPLGIQGIKSLDEALKRFLS